MSEEIMKEVYFFLSSMTAGVVVTFVYDLIRIFRRTIVHNKTWMAVEDVIFWVVSATYIYITIYFFNDGGVRLTAVTALLIGVCFYHYTISRGLVKWGFRLIANPIKKVIQLVIKALKNLLKRVKIILQLF